MEKEQLKYAYDTYIRIITEQLKEAKRQVDRIPELEKMSNLSFEDFLKLRDKKIIPEHGIS